MSDKQLLQQVQAALTRSLSYGPSLFEYTNGDNREGSAEKKGTEEWAKQGIQMIFLGLFIEAFLPSCQLT